MFRCVFAFGGVLERVRGGFWGGGVGGGFGGVLGWANNVLCAASCHVCKTVFLLRSAHGLVTSSRCCCGYALRVMCLRSAHGLVASAHCVVTA